MDISIKDNGRVNEECENKDNNCQEGVMENGKVDKVCENKGNGCEEWDMEEENTESRNEANDGEQFNFKDDCVSYKEINKRTIGRLILKYCGNEGTVDNKEKASMRRLLQEVIDYLPNEKDNVWLNACITIYDTNTNSLRITSGSGKNRYLVVEDDGKTEITKGGASVRVVNQLLTEMDGLEERKQVFIMGATNRPDIIDPAVLRPGRLDKTIYVGLPTPEDRLDILLTVTKKPRLAEDVCLQAVAGDNRCTGYTGADLAALVREASVCALRAVISSTGDNKPSLLVTKEHFELAFSRVKPSVSTKEQQKYEQMKVHCL